MAVAAGFGRFGGIYTRHGSSPASYVLIPSSFDIRRPAWRALRNGTLLPFGYLCSLGMFWRKRLDVLGNLSR